ncbi:ATP-citrate synthase, putative [Brugia malayi]|uniref:ATP-citrate synthase n=2 Tax=Brugia TaxID=6278 RepID=A0A0J9Y927_BRUMA|nr:ATP-citrate synthase, putative [Brugia malayi]CDQ04277.1 Bm1778 [Brugia malayi]VIO88263.1 ATP-citrate synthase, putative [Brugia malayi]
MSAKAISEYTGKELLYRYLEELEFIEKPQTLRLVSSDSFDTVTDKIEWLTHDKKAVIKPDQLIKRRGKLGLVKCGNLSVLREWFNEMKDKSIQIGKTVGTLQNFILEPFCNHSDSDEMYIAIISRREDDVILFYEHGGVDVGNIDDKARKLHIPIDLDKQSGSISDDDLESLIGPNESQKLLLLKTFVKALYHVYKENYFTYLEINPFVLVNNKIYILDLAAKLDETALFLCSENWKTRNGEPIDFPAPFGRDKMAEEKYVAGLDSKTGASLKLTILNRRGRIWTMVAGGGASVVYTDTICDLGRMSELANYGEYSGDPSEVMTYEYAKTILSVLTEGPPHPKGKILIIGGSIANFTNVAKTFKGIIKALEEYGKRLHEHKVIIHVRRGGPNYQEGLRKMKETGSRLNLPIHVYGPETHMTSIVAAALGLCRTPDSPLAVQTTGQFLLPLEADTVKAIESEPSVNMRSPAKKAIKLAESREEPMETNDSGIKVEGSLFESDTKAIVWGQQVKAIQGMLDFDFVCGRSQPSVVASTYPFTGDHKQKYYFGQKEILVPVYKSMKDAFNKHHDVSVFITFASLRSVYVTVREALDFAQIRVIAIIAEGMPENQTRHLIKLANEKGVTLIGPATVGGIKPGCFKIGNTGGMMDNILSLKLYRPGSVAYVSRSGGMSNELNNIISQNADGVYEGIAIGGDKYPGSTFVDHLLRYEMDDRVKMMVMLGELGGVEEYKVVEALKEKRLTKPLVAWCIGTCADYVTFEIQFGHAGASANAKAETATAKNLALKEAGAHVPNSFDDLGDEIAKIYKELLQKEVIVLKEEQLPPTVPMDYTWARELGLIRKSASFMTSICDERGDELLYAGMPISRVLEQDIGIGGVLSLLWFQKRLPDYANKFIEMCLMITADHGPAVSGAHNTIVCTRAGKDLVSSLVSGLLTIGDRFGGALDGAARQFSEAFDKGLSPMQFVNKQRLAGEHIMGIGHRVKSINNPDKRIEILKDFVLDPEKFKQETPLLEYALKVEKITTSKKANLILNVDGAIGVIFVDILRCSGMFTPEEAQEIIEIGAINGLFVLGRSIGFIGHYLDQRRLKQGLYRHPWDDITYILPEREFSGDLNA